jgi:HAL2 family 3'(2'),5'-bisphosphate nucleotidase
MSDRSRDLATAVAAVRSAARVCRAVQERLVRPEALEKGDKSPVTVADFASQAIICAELERELPRDPIVGEEDANTLRHEASLLAAVVERVSDQRGAASEEQVLAWIDRGTAAASAPRYWTLDPIDGTKGFLRREQYAIALALIERGRVEIGVLGCPNLPLGNGIGALFTAVRGEPTLMQDLWNPDAPARTVSVAKLERADQARFCESVESGHSDQGESARIAEDLGIKSEPFRIDSQCKYAAVARNDASIYLRLPTRADYREKIWDHAAGSLVVECAGGRVTDSDGAPLDFTVGATLANNRGIVATCGSIHDEVIAAVRRARSATV